MSLTSVVRSLVISQGVSCFVIAFDLIAPEESDYWKLSRFQE